MKEILIDLKEFQKDLLDEKILLKEIAKKYKISLSRLRQVRLDNNLLFRTKGRKKGPQKIKIKLIGLSKQENQLLNKQIEKERRK